MAFHDIRFPANLSFGSVGGPERRTEIVTLQNGHEERNTPWAHSRRRYDAGLGLRSLDDIGTLIGPDNVRGALTGRKRWIAYFNKPQGALVIDEGARLAIQRKGKSLLPIGIKAVNGEFRAGSAVEIKGPNGVVVARGLSDYSSEDVHRIMGHHTADLKRILGAEAYEEVVHRDNMVVTEGDR